MLVDLPPDLSHLIIKYLVLSDHRSNIIDRLYY